MFQRELVIDEPGVMLGKKSQRLVIKKNGEILTEIPVMELKDVIILSNGVTISSDLIQLLMEQGTQIHFLDYREMPYAIIYSAVSARHGQDTKRAVCQPGRPARSRNREKAV